MHASPSRETVRNVIRDYQFAAGAEYKVVADWMQELLDDGEDIDLVKASLETLIEAAQAALRNL